MSSRPVRPSVSRPQGAVTQRPAVYQLSAANAASADALAATERKAESEVYGPFCFRAPDVFFFSVFLGSRLCLLAAFLHVGVSLQPAGAGEGERGV